LSAVLEIDGLQRWFGARVVVHGLDLAAEPGERIALRGPNGSGKTTVLRCAAGTMIPSAGTVRVGGHPAHSIAARGITGVSLSQERAFYLRLSGAANLRFYARVRGLDTTQAARAVDALAEELEIGAILAERGDRCSTGMLQQLSFARALLGDPKVLLLDEPTRSLDQEAIARVWAALERRPEATVLIATHHDDDAARCHRTLSFPL
jgi:ABC-type multidrug transport system ATPase subunit